MNEVESNKRANWKLVRAYLKYREEVHLVSQKTVRNEETWLLHLLYWAWGNHFRNTPKIRPSFPKYMLTARSDGKKGQLSPAYIKKVITSARRFLEWLSINKRIRSINAVYLDTLRTPRITMIPKEPEAYTLEEIRAIAAVPVQTIKEERIRASAVFLWLSGMRVGAFSSLSLQCVDLEKLEIKQWPGLGVRTKNNKHATTSPLPIPDLLDVVKAWDHKLRQLLPPEGMWYAPLLPMTGNFDLSANIQNYPDNRRTMVTRNLRQWMDKIDLPYRSAHQFRHGFMKFIKENAKDEAQKEAAREILMQETLLTTTYGKFNHADITKQMRQMVGDDMKAKIEEIPPEDWPKILEIYKIIRS